MRGARLAKGALRPRSARGVRLTAAAALLALLAVGATGCSKPARWQSPGGGSSSSAAAKFAGTLSLTPADGAADVPVLDPVTVTARDATLDSVSVVNPEGKPVAGELAADKSSWKSSEPLGYNKTYRATVGATDGKGRQQTQTSTFTTVKPANLTLPYLRANAMVLLADRPTFGVGQPIVVHFDEKITDRAAAEKALQVTTEPKVVGAWHWYTNQDVHWRPQEYWASGTKVTVTAKVYGVNLGGGLYGQQDVSTSFAIGPRKIAIADDSTLRIEVSINGKHERTVLTSMGKHQTQQGKNGQTLDLRTRSGVHVVLGTHQVTRMTGESWGSADSYDKDIRYTTHLSYAGEYIHEADWNVGKHGRVHDSHGCLNVGTNDAIWFMNNFGPGDVVEVKNSGIQLDNMDGLTDWNMSWADWLKGSALGAS